MNESILIQLKIIVERAVRPVRAGRTRKRKLREELLAHVTDVFGEELASLHDERAALDRTAQRFGNPAELTAQLQATIPASDVVERWLFGAPGESTLRSAARLAAWNLALGVFVFAAAIVLSGPATAWPMEVIVFAGASVLLLPAFMFSLSFATEWIRHAWYEPARRSPWKAAALTIGWFLFILVLMEGVTWLNGTTALSDDPMTRIALVVWLAASIPWMPWALAHATQGGVQHQREWANLRIE